MYRANTYIKKKKRKTTIFQGLDCYRNVSNIVDFRQFQLEVVPLSFIPVDHPVDRRGPPCVGARPCEYRMHYSRTAETGCTAPALTREALHKRWRGKLHRAGRFGFSIRALPITRSARGGVVIAVRGIFDRAFRFRAEHARAPLFINSHAVYRALNRVAGWILIDLENRKYRAGLFARKGKKYCDRVDGSVLIWKIEGWA